MKAKPSPVGRFVDDFKALTPKQWISVILGIAIAVIILIMIGIQCFGFLIAAVALYMIPHMMGVSSVKVKTVAGVAFIIVAMLACTAYSTSLLENTENGASYNNDVSNVTYDSENDILEFDIALETDEHPLVQVGAVSGFKFNTLELDSATLFIESGQELESGDRTTVIDNRMTVTPGADGKSHVVVANLIEDGGLSSISIGIMGNSSVFYSMIINADNQSYTSLSIENSAYQVAIAAVAFFIILIFSALMRRSAEKTRAKMEAEGRLYPKGYGTCKNCGAMVLPGEVNCRKCGAYIDVPEELKPQKKDFFTCSECGAEVPADAKVCPKCGATFDEEDENTVVHADGTEDVSNESVTCPECGNIVPANADWCPRCGKMLK